MKQLKIHEWDGSGIRTFSIISPVHYPLSLHFLSEQARWKGTEIVYCEEVDA